MRNIITLAFAMLLAACGTELPDAGDRPDPPPPPVPTHTRSCTLTSYCADGTNVARPILDCASEIGSPRNDNADLRACLDPCPTDAPAYECEITACTIADDQCLVDPPTELH